MQLLSATPEVNPGYRILLSGEAQIQHLVIFGAFETILHRQLILPLSQGFHVSPFRTAYKVTDLLASVFF